MVSDLFCFATTLQQQSYTAFAGAEAVKPKLLQQATLARYGDKKPLETHFALKTANAPIGQHLQNTLTSTMSNFFASRGRQTFVLVPLFVTNVDRLLNIKLKPVSLNHQFVQKTAELAGALPLKKDC